MTANGTLIRAILVVIYKLRPSRPIRVVIGTISFSFASVFLVVFVTVTFNGPNHFVSVVLLIVRLKSYNNSFPVRVAHKVGNFFRTVGPCLPVACSICKFHRTLASKLKTGRILRSILVRLVFVTTFLVLLCIAVHIVHPRRRFRKRVRSRCPNGWAIMGS